jgi:hypothetical protein
VHQPMSSEWMPERRARPASVIPVQPRISSVWMPARRARPLFG